MISFLKSLSLYIRLESLIDRWNCYGACHLNFSFSCKTVIIKYFHRIISNIITCVCYFFLCWGCSCFFFFQLGIWQICVVNEPRHFDVMYAFQKCFLYWLWVYWIYLDSNGSSNQSCSMLNLSVFKRMIESENIHDEWYFM